MNNQEQPNIFDALFARTVGEDGRGNPILFTASRPEPNVNGPDITFVLKQPPDEEALVAERSPIALRNALAESDLPLSFKHAVHERDRCKARGSIADSPNREGVNNFLELFDRYIQLRVKEEVYGVLDQQLIAPENSLWTTQNVINRQNLEHLTFHVLPQHTYADEIFDLQRLEKGGKFSATTPYSAIMYLPSTDREVPTYKSFFENNPLFSINDYAARTSKPHGEDLIRHNGRAVGKPHLETQNNEPLLNFRRHLDLEIDEMIEDLKGMQNKRNRMKLKHARLNELGSGVSPAESPDSGTSHTRRIADNGSTPLILGDVLSPAKRGHVESGEVLDADTARKALLDFINTHAQVHNVIDPEAERKPAGPCDRPAPFIYPSDERDVAMRPFDKKEFYALIDQYSQAMKHALSEEERHYHLDILKPNGTKPFFIRTKLSKWLFSDDMPRVGSSGAAYEKCKDTTYAFMKLLDATQDYILVTPENLRDGTLRERPQTMSDLAAALMEEPTLYPVRRQAVDNILNAGGASGPALTGGAPRLR